jgi:hypothetical protein
MNPDSDNLPEPELLPKLAEALRSLNRPKVVVPPSVDAAIAKAATDHLQHEMGRATAPAEPPGGELNSERPLRHLRSAAELPESLACRSDALRTARREASPYLWLAAAAALVIGLFLLRPWERSSHEELRADLDHSGQVDVLDAFLLARKLAAGTAGPEFDLNGDGVVDRRDVDLAANQAVRLPSGI